MTPESAAEQGAPQDVPTFSECVIGYRAWRADGEDRLWPLASKRRPWTPGINTARCNCVVPNSLQFDWTWEGGRRVLERTPGHAAPRSDCECGLYSLRRPPWRWAQDPRCSAGKLVIGAVASWGRLQVHRTGVRAEHACVVTLALPPDGTAEAGASLPRIARRYRVDLVPLGELEEAASRHGTPLPDTLRPPLRAAPSPAARTPPARAAPSRPRAAPSHTTTRRPREAGVPAPRRRARAHHVGLILVFAFVLALVVVLVTARPKGTCRWELKYYAPGDEVPTCVAASPPHG